MYYIIIGLMISLFNLLYWTVNYKQVEYKAVDRYNTPLALLTYTLGFPAMIIKFTLKYTIGYPLFWILSWKFWHKKIF